MDKLKLDNTLLIRLTKGQKIIYDAFYKAMKNGQYEVILPTAINRDNIIYYLYDAYLILNIKKSCKETKFY